LLAGVVRASRKETWGAIGPYSPNLQIRVF